MNRFFYNIIKTIFIILIINSTLYASTIAEPKLNWSWEYQAKELTIIPSDCIDLNINIYNHDTSSYDLVIGTALLSAYLGIGKHWEFISNVYPYGEKLSPGEFYSFHYGSYTPTDNEYISPGIIYIKNPNILQIMEVGPRYFSVWACDENGDKIFDSTQEVLEMLEVTVVKNVPVLNTASLLASGLLLVLFGRNIRPLHNK